MARTPRKSLSYPPLSAPSWIFRYATDIFAVFALFLLPFTWYQEGYVQVGGDASRLFLVWPDQWIQNVSDGSRKVWTAGSTNVIQSYLDPYIYLLKALSLNTAGDVGAWTDAAEHWITSLWNGSGAASNTKTCI